MLLDEGYTVVAFDVREPALISLKSALEKEKPGSGAAMHLFAVDVRALRLWCIMRW